ncbi:MAG: O-antigen ligase family protein [Crocinitomicaceae bacterium]|nr:O-antigen ligase family protein [Crocinitomicaceae bacterium]
MWFLIAIAQLKMTGFNRSGLLDIRSLAMQCVFCLLLFSSYYKLGKLEFQRLLIIGLRSFLIILLVAGAVEYYTGIHFAGKTTADFPLMVIGNIFYAPMFIYDNPNDYLLYSLMIFVLLKLFDKVFKQNNLIGILTLVVLFVFAQYADSKFARIAIGGLFLFELLVLFFKNRKRIAKQKHWPFIVSAVLFILLVASNSLFFGPKYAYSKQYRLNAIELLSKKGSQFELKKVRDSLTKQEQLALLDYLDSLNTKSPEVAVNLRKNLILNGIDIIMENPVLGIGPGGFHTRLAQGKQRYFIHNHVSPHNFPIEIISQFGLVGWLYLCIIFGLFILVMKSVRDHLRNNPWILALFMLLPIFWMMPSAYLYLDIHWLLLPIVLIFFDIHSSKHVNHVVEQ